MTSSKSRESCGRCSFSTVLDAVGAGYEDADEEGEDGERARRDPLEGGRIEVDERDLRLAAAPALAAGRAKRFLDEAAERLIHGR